MKNFIIKLLGVLIGAMSITSGMAYAYEPATLQIQISNAPTHTFYLCVSSVGCVRIDSGKTSIPIDPINVRYIFVANISTDQMYPQNLPNSCKNIAVNANQKLVVKGQLVKAANDDMYVANLRCAVS
jgi:hypothetical protein